MSVPLGHSAQFALETRGKMNFSFGSVNFYARELIRIIRSVAIVHP